MYLSLRDKASLKNNSHNTIIKHTRINNNSFLSFNIQIEFIFLWFFHKCPFFLFFFLESDPSKVYKLHLINKSLNGFLICFVSFTLICWRSWVVCPVEFPTFEILLVVFLEWYLTYFFILSIFLWTGNRPRDLIQFKFKFWASCFLGSVLALFFFPCPGFCT